MTGPERRLDALWERVDSEIDGAPRGLPERLLVRLGIPDHLARLLSVTPSLRLSWLSAVAVVLLAAAWTARFQDVAAAPLILLILAPLVPVAGVAVAYGPGVDPAYEVTVVAPLSGLRLTLLRTAAVLASAVPISVAAALVAGDTATRAAGWLLPSLALTVLVLCLQLRLGPVAAPTLVAGGWVGLVAGAEMLPGGGTPAAGQLGCLLAAVLTSGWLWVGRDRFEVGHGYSRSAS